MYVYIHFTLKTQESQLEEAIVFVLSHLSLSSPWQRFHVLTVILLPMTARKTL